MKWKVLFALSITDKAIGWIGYFGTPDDVKQAWRLFLWLSVENMIVAWITLNSVIAVVAWYYVLKSRNPPWLARVPIIRNTARENNTYPLKDDLIKLSNTVHSHAQNLGGTWETRTGPNYEMERQKLLLGFQRHQIPHPDGWGNDSHWYKFCVQIYPHIERGDIDGCRQVYNSQKRHGEPR